MKKMEISVDLLWIIYAITLLILGLIFVSFSSNSKKNPVYIALLVSFLAALLVFVLSLVYVDPATLSDDDRNNLNLLYWVSNGLVVIFLIWSIFSYKSSREKNSGDVDTTVITVKCDENDNCKVTGISSVVFDQGGVHIMSIKDENNDEEKVYSPIGKMKIKYLV